MAERANVNGMWSRLLNREWSFDWRGKRVNPILTKAPSNLAKKQKKEAANRTHPPHPGIPSHFQFCSLSKHATHNGSGVSRCVRWAPRSRTREGILWEN